MTPEKIRVAYTSASAPVVQCYTFISGLRERVNLLSAALNGSVVAQFDGNKQR